MVLLERGESNMQESQYVQNAEFLRTSLNRFVPVDPNEPISFEYQREYALSGDQYDNPNGTQAYGASNRLADPNRLSQSRFYKSER